MDWYFKVLRNYIGFGGRARRKEYWMFHLVNFILAGVLSVLDKILGLHIAKDEGALTTIYTVLVLLPLWAVQFRRLHDTDRSAWWLLLLLIPIVGWLIILAFNCQDGTPATNRFGPDPKAPELY
ncbi:membrane protein [Klebsiella michiganensis]|nr:membrane protein [Klebsiella michiganensis]